MKQKQILELDDPTKVSALAECYYMIDYYYDMIEIAESKRDALIKVMSLSDIKYAIQKSSYLGKRGK